MNSSWNHLVWKWNQNLKCLMNIFIEMCFRNCSSCRAYEINEKNEVKCMQNAAFHRSQRREIRWTRQRQREKWKNLLRLYCSRFRTVDVVYAQRRKNEIQPRNMEACIVLHICTYMMVHFAFFPFVAFLQCDRNTVELLNHLCAYALPMHQLLVRCFFRVSLSSMLSFFLFYFHEMRVTMLPMICLRWKHY